MTLGLITNHTESISSTLTLSTNSSTTATPLLPVNLNLFLIRFWNQYQLYYRKDKKNPTVKEVYHIGTLCLCGQACLIASFITEVL